MLNKYKSPKKQKQKKVNCNYCKREFWCFLSWINRRKKIYCSKDCLKKDIDSNKKTDTIRFCQNEFCKKKLNIGQVKYCSIKCNSYTKSNKYKLDLKIKNEKKLITKINNEKEELRKTLKIKRNL